MPERYHAKSDESVDFEPIRRVRQRELAERAILRVADVSVSEQNNLAVTLTVGGGVYKTIFEGGSRRMTPAPEGFLEGFKALAVARKAAAADRRRSFGHQPENLSASIDGEESNNV